uniref:Metallo-beta-lactamase domain-containing protein n=1 Tax=Arcella intermedia TaxID=1963864 RepID=A0A6B2LBP1_9EUKA
MGTGCSTGTPDLGCAIERKAFMCGVCRDALANLHSPNRRNNPSVLIQLRHTKKNILIDCGKTFREGALRWFPARGVNALDALVLTHEHTDAIGGMDDLRDAQVPSGVLPVFANQFTHNRLVQKYPYLFGEGSDSKSVGRRIAQLEARVISKHTKFNVEGLSFTPFDLIHGGSYISLGFAFGSPDEVVYFSDFSEIPEECYNMLNNRKISVMVLDMLRESPNHPSHPTLAQTIQVIHRMLKICEIKKIYLIGMNHTVDHHPTNLMLNQLFPDGLVELSYDGLTINLDLTPPTANL